MGQRLQPVVGIIYLLLSTAVPATISISFNLSILVLVKLFDTGLLQSQLSPGQARRIWETAERLSGAAEISGKQNKELQRRGQVKSEMGNQSIVSREEGQEW